MATSDPAETERVIRQKLESSGQYGKMRAMIMEAALQTVQSGSSDSSGAATATSAKPSFAPSAALVEAKAHQVVELSVVVEYLRALGLQYTESVLCLEAGISAAALHTSADLQQRLGVTSATTADTCLTALVKGGGGGGGGADRIGSAAPHQAEKPTSPPAVAAATTAVVEEPADEEAGEASDHDQPGAEDSTYFISKWTRRHFVRHGQVTGQQVQLDRLTDCQTIVLDELDSMTADDCEGGELVVAACEGSVFLRNCKNMTVHVACKQLRTRDCSNIDLHIFTTTDPVVEMSHDIHFYPFHLRLPSLRKLFADARLDAKLNRFVHVYDFTPSEPGLPQPHFQVHFPDHGQHMEDRGASYGAPECPPEVEQLLALQLMPAASSESGKNKSYDIKTGAQVWAAGGVSAAPVAAAAVVSAVPAAAAAPQGRTASSSPDRSSVHSSSVSDIASDSDSVATDDSDDDSAAAAAAKAKKTSAAGAAAVPAPVSAPPAAARAAATAGGLDNEEYSSFDDESDGHDADDKYDVDEDEDDF